MDRMALPIARRATRASLPLVGAFAVGAIAYGGLYTFPAISVAFATEFGISRTLAVTPWTMFLVVTAVASPLLGRAYDEWADRDLLTASMVLLAAGWLAVYLAREISLVILAYAVFMALGLQLSFLGTTTAIARRYAGMSGLALGIAYAGPGIGVALALPLAGGLIATAGWRPTSLVFLAACLVGVAFVWLMTSGPAIVVPARRPERRRSAAPSDVRGAADPVAAQEDLASGRRRRSGRRWRWASPSAPASSTSAGRSRCRPARPPGSTRCRRRARYRPPARSSPSGAAITLAASGASSGPAASGSCSRGRPRSASSTRASCRRSSRAPWPGGLGAGWAATALGLQSLAYVGGQIVGGWLSDHVGRRVVGVAAAAAVGGGVVAALGMVGSVPAVAAAGIIVHGVGTGATIAVRSAAFGDVFGGPSFGTIFGLLGVAYPVGGTLAVYLGAVALDATGSYAPLIPVILGAVVLWSVALWIAGPRRPRAMARDVAA